MPRYDYKCPKCETIREVEHSIKDDPIIVCQEDGEEMKRVPCSTSFKLRGEGWTGHSKKHAPPWKPGMKR